MRLTNTLRATTAVVALSLLTVACGSSSSSGTSNSSSSSSTSSSSTSSSDTAGGSSAAGSVSAGDSASAAPSGTTAATSAPGASAAPGGSSTGTLTIWADDLASPALKAAAADFAAANGIQATVQTISKDLQAQFVTASQAGNAPDLVLGANDWIGNLVQNGAIDPVTLDATTKASFNPVSITGVTFNSQVYGVPFDVENIALIRNTDLAPNAPATMEDLISTGQALVKSGKTSEIMSLPQGQNGDPYHLYPLFVSAGGTLFGKTSSGDDNPKDLQIDSAASIAAMTKIAAIGEKGSGALKRSITDDNALSIFTDKKTAFLVTGPWNLAALKKSGIKFDVSIIPPFTGGVAASPFVGVQALFVASKGKNKALAQEFASNYFGTPAVAQALYTAYGRPPALTAVYNTVASSDPLVAKFAQGANPKNILPSIPQMQSVWTPWGIAEAAIIGGADPSSSMKKAAETVRAAIK